jgi:hypothetical protein
MKVAISQLNLVLAWAWILLGFISGLGLGMKFHEENWLGGYASLRRRMYRLAHISFFGLGAVNLLFHFSRGSLGSSRSVEVASWLFVLGAITMPLCCILMAHIPRSRNLFAVPVLSLTAAGALVLYHLLLP